MATERIQVRLWTAGHFLFDVDDKAVVRHNRTASWFFDAVWFSVKLRVARPQGSHRGPGSISII